MAGYTSVLSDRGIYGNLARMPMITTMPLSSFTDRSYRVAQGGRSVVCDTVATREELDSLREAIAWRRNAHSLSAFDDAESVIMLRALISLDDLLFETTAVESEALVTVDREQARLLCEVAGAYVAERDVDSYQPLEERERIARLRGLSGSLMDTCCELAAAEQEANEKELLTAP